MLMGESLVETPTLEEKMGDPMTHVACLQESVSFGRFEHDSLCWERWSTFPTNKYLEEVEKCSTPGSVAQKKAYFEAHYKRIAARKAELMDQDKNKEIEPSGSEDLSRNLMDSVYNSSGEEVEIEKSVTHDPVSETELESKSIDFVQEIDVPIDDVGSIGEENKVDTFTGEAGEPHFDVLTDGTSTIVAESEVVDLESEVCEHIEEYNHGADVFEEKHIQPQPEVATDELVCVEEKVIELKSEETDFVKGEAVSMLASRDKAVPHLEVKEMVKKESEQVVIMETPKNVKKVTSKTTNSTNAKKKTVTLMTKRSATQMPKKPSTPTPKTPIPSTPELSKPVQSRIAMSATRPSAKKENGPTPLSTTKKAAKPENKRVGPTSLHMSFSLAPGNSDPATLGTRRKSLIMESMGDKDIVKRAFKAFEKPNLLSSNASLPRSPATTQPVTRKTEHKGSRPATLEKKNEGILRSVKPAGPCSDQGTVKPSFQPGLRKNTAMDQRNGKSTPSFGSRSLNLGNKPKEILKKLDQKSMTKETGRAQTPSKVTMEKSVETRRTVRSMNSKANLSSSWNQGRVSKLPLKKDAKASS